MPEEKRAELEKVLEKDARGFESVLDEVRFNVYCKNYDKALNMIEDLIHKYKKAGMYSNDKVSEYFCFREAMEDLLYRNYNDSSKEIRQSPIDYAEIYLLYGSLLIELKKIEDAAEALKKARRWNPANAKIGFEYAETFKIQGKMEEFAEETRGLFKYSFRPDDLARCYRNMAFYYTEKEEYKTAVCCLMFSGVFESSEMISSELYYISQETGEMYNPSANEIEECLKAHKIPYGPDEEILQMSYAYGKHFYEEGDMEAAKYFLEIFDGFIKDDEISEILIKINVER